MSAEDITTLEQLMALLEGPSADQRAVLQLVVQRGRTYDEIATLLSIDRSAVRQRALDACMALTPDTIEPGPERALVTDYLLGQLPDQVADQVYVYLEAAEADREWAASVAEELSVLSPRPLAEVPNGVATAPTPAADDGYRDEYEDSEEPYDAPEDHTYTPLPRDWEPVSQPPRRCRAGACTRTSSAEPCGCRPRVGAAASYRCCRADSWLSRSWLPQSW